MTDNLFGGTLNPTTLLLFTGLLLVPYGLIYLARTVCIEHCLDVNHVCITVARGINDSDDDDK